VFVNVATIRYVPTSPGNDPAEREVPDEAYPTDRGVQWSDESGIHIVPWSAILEFVVTERQAIHRDPFRRGVVAFSANNGGRFARL
jgi:hypothetical protein